MAKQRYINTRFWEDNYIFNLDPTEKLLFMYFLTSPLTSICGIYEISTRRIAFDTGIDSLMVEKIIKRFSDDGKMHYHKGYIYIVNFISHQSLNPKIKRGIEKALEEIPSDILEYFGVSFSAEEDAIKFKRREISASLRFDVFSKCNNKCVICGSDSTTSLLEVDHIIPVSKGGSNDLSNLQILCQACNNGKSDKIDYDSLSDFNSNGNNNSNCNIKVKPTKEKFTPPTKEEADAYCKQENLNVDTFKFIKYYAAADWKIKDGKKMKNWKQALARWHTPTPEQERRLKARETDADIDRIYKK